MINEAMYHSGIRPIPALPYYTAQTMDARHVLQCNLDSTNDFWHGVGEHFGKV